MGSKVYPPPPPRVDALKTVEAELMLTKMSLDVARRRGDWAMAERQVKHMDALLERRAVLARKVPA